VSAAARTLKRSSEAVVSALEARRDHTVDELERLRAELGSTLGTHTAASRAQHGTGKKREQSAATAKDDGPVPVRSKS
jgi:hypothetical protein